MSFKGIVGVGGSFVGLIIFLKIFFFKHSLGKTIVHAGKEYLKDQTKDKVKESLSKKEDKPENLDQRQYMALIQCPECKIEISEKATACPKCGHPIGFSTNSISASSRVNNPNKLPIYIGLGMVALISYCFYQNEKTQKTVYVQHKSVTETLLDEKFVVSSKRTIERTFQLTHLSNVKAELNVLEDDKPTNPSLQVGWQGLYAKIGTEYYKKGKPINVVLMDEDNYSKYLSLGNSADIATLENFSKQSTIGFNAQDKLKAGKYVFLFYFRPTKGFFRPKLTSTISLKLMAQGL